MNEIQINARYVDLVATYRAELLGRVVPFWIERAIDWQHGGILTCISDEGKVLSQDKYLWSQLRAIWTFSALYNKIQRKQEWLDIARQIFDFVKKYGRDEKGQWVFCVSKDGEIVRGAESIFSDGFAIYGFTELARATGDSEVIDLALETYDNVQSRLSSSGAYKTEPWPVPEGVKAHGISMSFSLAFNELGHYLGNQEIINASLFHANEVMDVYLRPRRKLLFEYVEPDNSLSDSPYGRAIVPGHVIESMWFMIHIYRRLGDKARIRQAIEAIKWHIEFGWDHEYGGIVHARDAEGGSPWWRHADAKLWWPHTEALYALLLAYEISRERWCLDWFERVHNYAFSHYPVAKYGEWTQKLDRKGDRIIETVALPVKDPFHLPRSLIYCLEVLQKLAEE